MGVRPSVSLVRCLECKRPVAPQQKCDETTWHYKLLGNGFGCHDRSIRNLVEVSNMSQSPSKQTEHRCTAAAAHDRELPEVDLLSPLTIRGVTFRNRIFMSPMCQYSADEGM